MPATAVGQRRWRGGHRAGPPSRRPVCFPDLVGHADQHTFGRAGQLGPGAAGAGKLGQALGDPGGEEQGAADGLAGRAEFGQLVGMGDLTDVMGGGRVLARYRLTIARIIYPWTTLAYCSI
jgi:hypothetical protein